MIQSFSLAQQGRDAVAKSQLKQGLVILLLFVKNEEINDRRGWENLKGKLKKVSNKQFYAKQFIFLHHICRRVELG